MEDEKVVLELSWMDDCNYLVQTMDRGGYQWDTDRAYITQTAAFSRAEDIMSLRGISKVRVIDISNNDN